MTDRKLLLRQTALVYTLVLGIILFLGLEKEGTLFLPAFLSGLAVWFSDRTWVVIGATVSLLGFCILGAFTVGMYFVPAVLIMLLSFIPQGRRRSCQAS